MTDAGRYVVELPPHPSDLLAAWRWLVGADARLLGATALGDGLVGRSDGSVWLLDMVREAP